MWPGDLIKDTVKQYYGKSKIQCFWCLTCTRNPYILPLAAMILTVPFLNLASGSAQIYRSATIHHRRAAFRALI